MTTAIRPLILADITPGTLHNYARRLGLAPDEAERRLRAHFDAQDGDLASRCDAAMQAAAHRRDPNDRPLPDWTLVDTGHDRHRWRHIDAQGRIETVSGGSSTGWQIEIHLPDGAVLTPGPVAGGVAIAMRAAAATHERADRAGASPSRANSQA